VRVNCNARYGNGNWLYFIFSPSVKLTWQPSRGAEDEKAKIGIDTPVFHSNLPCREPGMTAISERGYQKLGSIDQWVEIHGRDSANPLLVTLHGGPGMPETPLLRHFNGALEETFTVVYWEQRGAGRTFRSDAPSSSMTVAQFITDLDQLVDSLRKRFNREKVVLLGHSWGSALGTLYSARFPEKVAHYAGVGQIGNLQASEEASLAFVLEEARRRGNARAVAALEALGRPPFDPPRLMVQRRWLGRFVGTIGTVPLWKALRLMLLSRGTSPFVLVPILRGMMYSLRSMWPELSRLDLEAVVPSLDVPVTFLLGRHDHQVDAQVAAHYFATLNAPEKNIVWLERSGHFAPFEEPDAFNSAMREIARQAANIA